MPKANRKNTVFTVIFHHNCEKCNNFVTKRQVFYSKKIKKFLKFNENFKMYLNIFTVLV